METAEHLHRDLLQDINRVAGKIQLPFRVGVHHCFARTSLNQCPLPAGYA
jgi:hypothetical protein